MRKNQYLEIAEEIFLVASELYMDDPENKYRNEGLKLELSKVSKHPEKVNLFALKNISKHFCKIIKYYQNRDSEKIIKEEITFYYQDNKGILEEIIGNAIVSVEFNLDTHNYFKKRRHQVFQNLKRQNKLRLPLWMKVLNSILYPPFIKNKDGALYFVWVIALLFLITVLFNFLF